MKFILAVVIPVDKFKVDADIPDAPIEADETNVESNVPTVAVVEFMFVDVMFKDINEFVVIKELISEFVKIFEQVKFDATIRLFDIYNPLLPLVLPLMLKVVQPST